MNKLAIALGTLALVGASAAQATTYTSEASFLAVINPSFYLEDFNGWTFGTPLNGSQTSWAAPGANGYGWTASQANGLYSNVGSLSTNTANLPLTITFTGAPVTAFGGNFTNTDISGNVIAGNVAITLSNGQVINLVNQTGSSFMGWTSDSLTAITSISILTSGATNNWPQVDHFYVGSAIPAPGALALMGLAGAIGARRRRA